MWTDRLHEEPLLQEGHVSLVLALHRAVLLLVDLLQLLQALRQGQTGWEGPRLYKPDWSVTFLNCSCICLSSFDASA